MCLLDKSRSLAPFRSGKIRSSQNLLRFRLSHLQEKKSPLALSQKKSLGQKSYLLHERGLRSSLLKITILLLLSLLQHPK